MLRSNIKTDLILIQITDLHLFTDKQGEPGRLNTFQSARAVVDHIKKHFPKRDTVLVTGDLVQEPNHHAYGLFIELVQALETPVYCLPGNHDSPLLMKELLNIGDIHSESQAGFNNWDIFFLNSWKQGAHGGFLTQADLQMLDHRLKQSGGSHALICLHHHPVSVGSPWMDSMILQNADKLFAVLDKYDQTRGIIWGHIHQEFSDTRNGVLLLGAPSTCHQFMPGAVEFQLDEKSSPGLRWLRLSDTGEIETGIERVELSTS